MKIKLPIWLILAGLVAATFAASFFPEGNEPKPGDTQGRSLIKINDLLYTGASSASPTTNSARAVSWQSGYVTLTGSNQGLGALLGLGSGNIAVRRAIVRTSITNSVAIQMGPSDALGQQDFTADQEYLIEVPDGAVFNLNGWVAKCATASQVLGIFYCF